MSSPRSSRNVNRKRGNNFSKEEELIFLAEIAKHKAIIENKKTNNVSSTDKNEAWKKILIGFNSNNMHLRTLDQIKSKYDNLKTKARKWAAEEKLNLKGTGGGPGTNEVADPVIEAVLEIINPKTVFGLRAVCDDDYEETPIVADIAIAEIQKNSDHQSLLNSRVVINNGSEPGSSKQCSRYYLSDDGDSDNQEAEINYSSGETMAKKVKRAVGQEITYMDTSIKETHKEPQRTNSRWNSYTTKMLKEPVNKRLRPKVPNPTFSAKEEYYRKKTELIEAEIKNIQRKAAEETAKFEEDRIIKSNKDSREQEEHDKRMLLLNIEIEKAKKKM